MTKYHVSILDSDLYKFTQQNAICRLYPDVSVVYRFINRDDRPFPEDFSKRLKEIIDSYRSIFLTKDEKSFLLDTCYFLNPVYLDFLEGYRYDPNEVGVQQDGTRLFLTIQGYWYRTILWEVPLLATISELYYEMMGQTGNGKDQRTEVNKKKAEGFAELGIHYSEFGARRRFSYENQKSVVADLKRYGKGHMLGTSNVHLAMIHDILPMGTIAHEFFQFHGARYGYLYANEAALEAWVTVYQGNLGIALSDTYTTGVFFQTFNTKYAKLFDGIRSDSGDPMDFIDTAVAHYNKMRINPLFKVALFSDGIGSMDQLKRIHAACKDKIMDRYGIGTWLSNDCGVSPLNIVIKLDAVDFGRGWRPTIKLSDDKRKYSGDPMEINRCKEALGIV